MKRAGLVSVVACVVALATAATHSAQEYPNAIVPTTTIKLFNGTSLANFDTWLVDDHASDPLRVFTVVDQIDGGPAIRISGEKWGGLATKEAYRNYKFVAEYRWGGATWGNRKAATRDSGVLLHSQGRLGNTARDFNGPWMRSVEFQIIEGGVGDLLPVGGFAEDGTQIRPSVKVLTRKDRDGENVYDPNGTVNTFTGGRINWWGRSEDWADRIDFRGPKDIETAGMGWTRIEAVADGSRFTFSVNGQVVNAASDSSFTSGKIMIQSEGAEIYFRRLDLEPLR